jgi:signal transduction histidine kinase
MPDRRPNLPLLAKLASWRPVLVDGALGVVLFVLSLPATVLRPGFGNGFALAIALGMTIPLIVRRRWPLAVFAVVALAAFAQWLARITIRPHDLAFLVALYTVAAYRSRRWTLAALAVGALGAALEWAQVAQRTGFNLAGLVAPLVVVSATGVLGTTLRTRRGYLVELEQRAVRLERERDAQARAAVAEERARIAREMHDMVAHRVGVIVSQADGASYVFDSAPEQARAALGVIADSGRAALSELRRLLGVLRNDEGQGAGPQPGVGDIDRLVEDLRASGLPVRYTIVGGRPSVEPGLALTVYRVVQESLTNTLKHAGPTTATSVVLRHQPGLVEVQVTDAGGVEAPTEPPSAPDGLPSGHGLVGMAERVAMYGGTLRAGPRPGGGWQVEACLPTGEP